MDYEVFAIDDKLAGTARHCGQVSASDAAELAAYTLEAFTVDRRDGANAVAYLAEDGALTFVDLNVADLPQDNRYPNTSGHLYSVMRNPAGTWDACRRAPGGHPVVLSTFHSAANAVAYAEKDARQVEAD